MNNEHPNKYLIERLVREEAPKYDLSYIDSPGFGSWRLSKDTCQLLGALCQAIKPRVVLEFGSGLSSLVLAHEAHKGNVGKIWSVDHQEDFPGHPREVLTNQVRDGTIVFNRFNIKATKYAGKYFQFYDIPSDFFGRVGKIDLVLIDAPPYYYKSREAALYAVYPTLSERAYVLLDDAKRESMEMVYLRNWRRYYGKGIETLFLPNEFEKGLSVVWPTGAEMVFNPFPISEKIGHAARMPIITVANAARRLKYSLITK